MYSDAVRYMWHLCDCNVILRIWGPPKDERESGYGLPMSTARGQAESSFAFCGQIYMLTQGPNEDTGLALEGEGVSCTPLRTTPLYTAFRRRWYGGRNNRYLGPRGLKRGR